MKHLVCRSESQGSSSQSCSVCGSASCAGHVCRLRASSRPQGKMPRVEKGESLALVAIFVWKRGGPVPEPLLGKRSGVRGCMCVSTPYSLLKP